jgi:hypothetical protein
MRCPSCAFENPEGLKLCNECLVAAHDAQLAPESPTHPLEWEPPAVDFLSYAQRTGGRVDYVLVWHVRSDLREHPDTHAIFHQLEQQYVPSTPPHSGDSCGCIHGRLRVQSGDQPSCKITGPCSCLVVPSRA